MKFARWHTQPEADPISRMRLRTYSVQQESLIVPEGWTEEALAVLMPHMGSEGFASHIYERLRAVRQWAEQEGYFASGEDAAAFKDECAYLFASRKMASTVWLDPVETSLEAGGEDAPENRHEALHQRLLGLEESVREPFMTRLKERAALDGYALQDRAAKPSTGLEVAADPGGWNPSLLNKAIAFDPSAKLEPPVHRTALSLSAFADGQSQRFDITGFRRAVRVAASLSLFAGLSDGTEAKNLGLRPTDTAAMLKEIGAPYDSPQGQAVMFCVGTIMGAEAAVVLSEAAAIQEGGSEARQLAVVKRLESALELLKAMPLLRLAPPPEFDPSQWLQKAREAAAFALEKVSAQPPLDIDPFWLGFDDELKALLSAESPGLMPIDPTHPNAQVQMAESFESGSGTGSMHVIAVGDAAESDRQAAFSLARELGLRFVRFTGEAVAAGDWRPHEVCGIALETLGTPPFAIRLAQEADSNLSAFVETLSLYLESGLPLKHLQAQLPEGSQAAMIVESLQS